MNKAVECGWSPYPFSVYVSGLVTRLRWPRWVVPLTETMPMKLCRALIHNFKGIKTLDIDFRDTVGTVRGLTCVVGDNGSGKTTVLQAVALVLALATRKIRFAHEFDWHGFLPDRMASQGGTSVELEVEFSADELTLTGELFRQWYDSLAAHWRETHQIIAPSAEARVILTYEQNRLASPGQQAALHQFLGRYYILALMRSAPRLRERFRDLGSIFWFDQHRNLGSPAARRFSENAGKDAPRESWQAGVSQLRQFLVGWWGFHTSPNKAGGKDYIPELEKRFSAIFPGRSFVGLRPRDNASNFGADDFYFLMKWRDQIYDLEEMSSGEQAVFPLVYEFVRLDIGRSIVLIDELELHLHPPEQQRLLYALPQLGPDCQFIVSTHSSFLTDIIPDEDEVRLDGGSRCL